MGDIEVEIVAKGELLRDLYLMREIIHSVNPYIVIDGIDTKRVFKTTLDKIEDLIPLVERELPEWAVELAKGTSDNRRGFVIWEEKFRLVSK